MINGTSARKLKDNDLKRRVKMSISYQPLFLTLTKKGITNITELVERGVISPPTLAKFNKRQYVSLETIEKVCRYLDVEPIEIFIFE